MTICACMGGTDPDVPCPDYPSRSLDDWAAIRSGSGRLTDTTDPTGRAIICEPDPECLDPHPHRWYCDRGHNGADPGVCLLKCCGGPGLADWQIRGFADEAAMIRADAS